MFRTSTDTTMKKFFIEFDKDNDITCLIQKSQLDRYQHLYPDIKYIDIGRESFYNLDEQFFNQFYDSSFDELYVTCSFNIAYNYGNVIEIADKIKSKRKFFYNCDGNHELMPQYNFIQSFLIKIYIFIVAKIYG